LRNNLKSVDVYKIIVIKQMQLITVMKDNNSRAKENGIVLVV